MQFKVGQFIVKALICAADRQKASVCKHAVIQSQICLWRSALNQMASRLYSIWRSGLENKPQNKTVIVLTVWISHYSKALLYI